MAQIGARQGIGLGGTVKNKARVYPIGREWWNAERAPSKEVLSFQRPLESPIDPKKVYSIADVAEQLSVSYQTVYRWANAGDLEVIMVGSRTRRIFGKSLIEFLSRLRRS